MPDPYRSRGVPIAISSVNALVRGGVLAIEETAGVFVRVNELPAPDGRSGAPIQCYRQQRPERWVRGGRDRDGRGLGWLRRERGSARGGGRAAPAVPRSTPRTQPQGSAG